MKEAMTQKTKEEELVGGEALQYYWTTEDQYMKHALHSAARATIIGYGLSDKRANLSVLRR